MKTESYTSPSHPKAAQFGTSTQPSNAGLTSSRALVREAHRFSRGFRLTPRETEIVTVLAEGITRIKDIADRLSLSPNTVNNHVNSIFMKTKARSKSQLLSMLLSRVSEELESARFFRQPPRVVVISNDSRFTDFVITDLKKRGFRAQAMDSMSNYGPKIAEMSPRFIAVHVPMFRDALGLIHPKRFIETVCASKVAHASPQVVFLGQPTEVPTLIEGERSEAMRHGAIDYIDADGELSCVTEKLASTLLGHYIDDEGDRARFYNRAHSPADVRTAQTVLDIAGMDLGRGGLFLSEGDVERLFPEVTGQFTNADLMGEANRLKIGDRLLLQLSCDGFPNVMSTQGEVVWIRTGDEQLRSGVGVRLLYFDGSNDGEVEDWKTLFRVRSSQTYIPDGRRETL